MSILRLSDFCAKPFDPLHVRLRLLECDGSIQYPEDSIQCHTTAIVIVTIGLLRRLSLRNGSVVWIRPTAEQTDKGRSENESLPKGMIYPKKGTIAARLYMNNDDVPHHHTYDIILIHPMTAINLGFFPSWNTRIDALVLPCRFRSLKELSVARKVTLRPWGKYPQVPPLGNVMDTASVTSDDSWIQPGCLLQPGKLFSIAHRRPETGVEQHDHIAARMSYFQVVEVISDNGRPDMSHSSYLMNYDDSKTENLPSLYRSDRSTSYRMETITRPWTCPQLPCLFTHDHPEGHISWSAPPHPNVSQLVDSMKLPGTATPYQRILTVLGNSSEHGVESAVRTAAARSGRRCLTVHGLAAHAHRCTGLVRSAGLIDKLSGLKLALSQAYASAPCVLFLMDFDLELTSQDVRLRHDEESRFLSLLTTRDGSLNHELMDEENGSVAHGPAVVTVLSMRKQLMKGPLMDNLIWEPVQLTRPDSAFAHYLWSQSDAPPVDDLWDILQGRTVDEITNLAQRVADAYSRENQNDPRQILQAIEETFKQSLNRSSISLIPQVTWQDVGGLSHVRDEILETIELPLRYPKLFASSTSGRTGLLLYGPPGTGKTLVAKAVANECGLPFVSIKGPELLGTYVGESEANVRAVFEKAREMARRSVPKRAAILFFDELDSLAPRRADEGGARGGASVMDRVVATLFAELDRPEGDCTIFCIGATNRPDMLDPALLRPGRLDRALYLGLSNLDRRQVLLVHLSKLKMEEDGAKMVERVLEHLANKHLSGADLASVVSSALVFATQRLCDKAESESKKNGKSVEETLSRWDADKLQPCVQIEDLIRAAEDVVPRVDEGQLARYDEIRERMKSKR